MPPKFCRSLIIMARLDPYWAVVPDSCWEIIVSQLSPSEAASARLVCRNWRIQISYVVTHLSPPPCAPVDSILKIFPGLRSLALTTLSTTGASSLCLPPAPALASLTSLTLRGCELYTGRPSVVGAHQLGQIAGIPHLASLEICHLTLELSGLELLPFSHTLKALHVDVLSTGTYLNEKDACISPFTCLRALETLTIGRLVPGPQDLTAVLGGISRLGALRSVSIGEATGMTHALFVEVARLPCLERLALLAPVWGQAAAGGMAVCDDSVASLAASCGALQSLTLRGHVRLTDACLRHIAGLATLTSLELDACDTARLAAGDSSAAWRDGTTRHLAALTHLQALCLRRWPIGQATCDTLSQLPLLTRLDLPRCAALNNTALFAIADLPLRELSLHSCSRVTDIGIASLGKGEVAQHLTCLDLSCTSVTDTGLKALCTLTALQTLDLACCGQVSDTGLLQLLPQVPQIRHLACTDTKVSDEVCVALAGWCPMLCTLRLEYCMLVTDAGAKGLHPLRHLQQVQAFATNISHEGCESLRRCTGAVVTLAKKCWWGPDGVVAA